MNRHAERRGKTLTGDGNARTETCWKYFNPPKKLWYSSLENYTPKVKSQQTALEKCKGYDLSELRQGKGLFLFGSWGAGKSHLSVATVRNLIKVNPEIFGVRQGEAEIYEGQKNQASYSGLTCSFFSVVELLDALRPGNEAKQTRGDWLMHRAKADSLVVLDDIGTEKASEWVEEKLYTIIDIRYRMERATILTSNCTEKELQDSLGGKIVSRIFGMTDTIPVVGPDHRRKGA